MVARQAFEVLYQAARPVYRYAYRIGRLANPEEQLLRMLCKKARACLQIPCLLEIAYFQRDRCTDRVAIAPGPTQAKCDRVSNILHNIAKDAELRSVAILEDDLKPSVAVQVGQCKRSAILQKVEPHDPGHLGKGAVTVVRKQNIALVAAPGTVRANQFIQRVPAVLVSKRGSRVIR